MAKISSVATKIEGWSCSRQKKRGMQKLAQGDWWCGGATSHTHTQTLTAPLSGGGAQLVLCPLINLWMPRAYKTWQKKKKLQKQQQKKARLSWHTLPHRTNPKKSSCRGARVQLRVVWHCSVFETVTGAIFGIMQIVFAIWCDGVEFFFAADAAAAGFALRYWV